MGDPCRIGEANANANRKMGAAFREGLRPILLVGEGSAEKGRAGVALAARLPRLFAGCHPDQVARMVAVYEPEWTIGVEAPASPDIIAIGCSIIREWIRRECGADAAEASRIIHGDSAAPEYAQGLLVSPDVDSLRASRKGQDATAFAEIVLLIAKFKGLVDRARS